MGLFELEVEDISFPLQNSPTHFENVQSLRQTAIATNTAPSISKTPVTRSTESDSISSKKKKESTGITDISATIKSHQKIIQTPIPPPLHQVPPGQSGNFLSAKPCPPPSAPTDQQTTQYRNTHARGLNVSCRSAHLKGKAQSFDEGRPR